MCHIITRHENGTNKLPYITDINNIFPFMITCDIVWHNILWCYTITDIDDVVSM